MYIQHTGTHRHTLIIIATHTLHICLGFRACPNDRLHHDAVQSHVYLGLGFSHCLPVMALVCIHKQCTNDTRVLCSNLSLKKTITIAVAALVNITDYILHSHILWSGKVFLSFVRYVIRFQSAMFCFMWHVSMAGSCVFLFCSWWS
jgi:hypothetical protein